VAGVISACPPIAYNFLTKKIVGKHLTPTTYDRKKVEMEFLPVFCPHDSENTSFFLVDYQRFTH
jgi:hypothetical protein